MTTSDWRQMGAMDRETYNRLLKEIKRLARWSPTYQLEKYHKLMGWNGVYMIFNRHRGPMYIGRSTNLGSRLRSYINGDHPARPPVFQVVSEKLANDPEGAARYHSLGAKEQRELRGQWMREADLMVRAAIINDPFDAAKLEGHLIRLYRDHGAELMNTITYEAGLAFPPPEMWK